MKQEFPVEAHYTYDGHQKRKLERFWRLKRLQWMDPKYLHNQWMTMVSNQN